jgi:prepilin-type processing-associated H-X9-DG protein
MRQIALALIQYSNDNQGKLIIEDIDPTPKNGKIPLLYPDGFGWQSELMHQNYLASVNEFTTPPNSVTGSPTYVPTNTVFRCPEDTQLEINSAGPTSGYPTDGQCAGYRDQPWGAGYPTRADQTPAYGVATSYMLNARANTAAAKNGGANWTPFVWFDSAETDTDPSGIGILDPAYCRTLSMIKHSALVIMVLETTALDWTEQNTNYLTTGVYTNRVAARHGQVSNNGLNASMNIAFFDGHVALYPTATVCGANLKTNPGGIIAYLGDQ